MVRHVIYLFIIIPDEEANKILKLQFEIYLEIRRDLKWLYKIFLLIIWIQITRKPIICLELMIASQNAYRRCKYRWYTRRKLPS